MSATRQRRRAPPRRGTGEGATLQQEWGGGSRGEPEPDRSRTEGEGGVLRKMAVVMELKRLIRIAEQLYPCDGKRYAGLLALSPRNGDIPASVLFVSEAPGLKGAGSTGIPFFTLRNEQSANRFAKLMMKIGADCDAKQGWCGHGVFVTDVVLRNPVETGRNGLRNRGLTRAEVKASLGLLRNQIGLVRPRVVVAVGKQACRALSELLACDVKIDGVFHDVPGEDFTVVGCPHPSPRNNARPHLRVVQEEVFGKLAVFLSAGVGQGFG